MNGSGKCEYCSRPIKNELVNKIIRGKQHIFCTEFCFRLYFYSVPTISFDDLNKICFQIKEIASKLGVPISGPIPLPNKKLKITTRKSPCGDGTATFDNFEMRIHSRVIDIPADDRVLHAVMRLYIPRNITIKIEMKE